MRLAAVACVLALVLLATAYRRPPDRDPKVGTAEGSRGGRLPPVRRVMALTVASAMWGCLNVGLVIFFIFGPAMLREQAISANGAAALTSSALWALTFSVPVGGFLVQRSGRTNIAIIAFSAIAACALGLLPAGFLLLPLCIAFGAAVGPPAGPIMSLPSRVLDADHRAVGFGLFYTFYNLILALGPGLAGLARDFSGTSAAAMLFGAALFISIAPLLLLFRMLEGPRPLSP
jgi:MFS family permease